MALETLYPKEETLFVILQKCDKVQVFLQTSDHVGGRGGIRKSLHQLAELTFQVLLVQHLKAERPTSAHCIESFSL